MILRLILESILMSVLILILKEKREKNLILMIKLMVMQFLETKICRMYLYCFFVLGLLVILQLKYMRVMCRKALEESAEKQSNNTIN